MSNFGWNLKLTRLWHRALASYLRAVATVLATFGLANAATDKIDLSALSTLGWSLLGALVAPLILAVTEAADLLEQADTPPPTP